MPSQGHVFELWRVFSVWQCAANAPESGKQFPLDHSVAGELIADRSANVLRYFVRAVLDVPDNFIAGIAADVKIQSPFERFPGFPIENEYWS
jgi:hypothetical protein